MQRPEIMMCRAGWPVPILVALLSISGCEKARLDDEVRRLCAIDGGVKVYETVILPAERFDKYGTVTISEFSNLQSSEDYYFRLVTKYFARGNPEMWRDHFQIIRKIDNKVLGESVSYSRRGGDLPGPWQSSSFGCPKETDISNLKKKIFRPASVSPK
jgi:hypothetical protein